MGILVAIGDLEQQFSGPGGCLMVGESARQLGTQEVDGGGARPRNPRSCKELE